jgi:hypothetical protein
LRKLRDSILVRKTLGSILGGEKPRQLLVLKTDQANVEILLLQCRKLRS